MKMNGLAVLVLRYTNTGQRRISRSPLNLTLRGKQFRSVWEFLHSVPFPDRLHNCYQPVQPWPAARFPFCCTSFSQISESESVAGVAHVEMDSSILTLEGELKPESVGAKAGNILVPISNHQMYHWGCAGFECKPGRRDVVCLHGAHPCAVRLSGEQDSTPDQILASIRTTSFFRKRFHMDGTKNAQIDSPGCS